MTKSFLLLVVLAVAGCACPRTETIFADPRQAAQNFYGMLRIYQVSGLPEGKAWREMEPLITPELAASIRAARKAQAVFIRKNPGEKPPWIEGDLFSSLFEGPQKHAIGEPTIIGDRAEVPVHLSHTDRSDTVHWTDTLILRRTPRGWLVDDVLYGGKWPFAPKGSLGETLGPEAC